MSDNEHQDDNPSPVDSEENWSEYEMTDLELQITDIQRQMECRLCSYIFFVDEEDLQEEESNVELDERTTMLVNYCQHLRMSTVELPADCSRRVFPLCTQCEIKMEGFRNTQRGMEFQTLLQTNDAISRTIRDFFIITKVLPARRDFKRSDVRQLAAAFPVIVEVYQRILRQEIPSGSRITLPTSQQEGEPMGEGELDRNRLDDGEGDGEGNGEGDGEN